MSDPKTVATGTGLLSPDGRRRRHSHWRRASYRSDKQFCVSHNVHVRDGVLSDQAEIGFPRLGLAIALERADRGGRIWDTALFCIV